MSNKTLGIDLGTNSIGWAIVENSENYHTLLDAGSLIFQEGVAREKGAEKPAVEKRTCSRASRRHYFRRRLIKISLLKVLIEAGLCPYISDDDLDLWRNRKKYPLIDEFIQWQRTNSDNNPYYARNEALSRELDLDHIEDRHLLGRALYHLAQRRGFLSNRKATTKDQDGAVKQGISLLSQEMEKAGYSYLGQYFFNLYQKGDKIRSRYTDRLAHSEKEFYAICDKQQLPESLVSKLHNAIFFQRPLKSQKGLIGKCIFEPNKHRCPVSHPDFEEYRMLAFINNIKICESDDNVYRPLSPKEKLQIIPLFLRKSKDTFDFDDIAKKIAGKGNYSFRDDKEQTPCKFNFRMSTSVAGCPVTAGLINTFGDNWKDTICSCYTQSYEKSPDAIINDVWHALYSFDSDEKLKEWAIKKLQLTADQAASFVKIKIPQGYAALSHKAIGKVLPHLRNGMRYDEAVSVANINTVLPDVIKNDRNKTTAIVETIANALADTELRKGMNKQIIMKQILEDIPGIKLNKINLLYHPSKLNIYPGAEPDANGTYLLGSPRTSSIRNPMAMRALFKLRHLINRLLTEGKITRDTRINIEFARGLNDTNMRKAIEQFNRENENKHKKYSDELTAYFKQAGINATPSETDILKYELWEEQEHRCLYTGRQIGIADLFGPYPSFDIEHTIPRAVGGDDSKANKTICLSSFNRQIKKAKLPSQLAGSEHTVILERIESLGWNKKIQELSNQIAKIRTSGAATKEMKDKLITKRHYLRLRLDYWRDKVRRFTMTEVPEGFTNRQGVDIGIIGKYAREYLKSLFNSEERQIFIVKGITTAEFRKMWGLQDEYSKKERVNHCHHAIDAIVIACIGRREYQQLAEYLRHADDYKLNGGEKPRFEKPWSTFTEDVKRLADNTLVVHQSPDNTLKQSRKKLKVNGRIRYNTTGRVLYQQGDSARGPLHLETFYGAIKRGDDTKYVLRKSLKDIAEKDIDRIVDDAVRQKIRQAVDERGFNHLLDNPIWMNETKGIEIKKVRIFTPSVTAPIHLKKHRDLSAMPHKQSYHVANDSNYLMAIYEGSGPKGSPKRSFTILSNLEAVKLRKAGQRLVPLSDAKDYPLRWILKTGLMVLMYENSPSEVYNASQQELAKRLYEITGLSKLPTGNGYGIITLRHHQEARPSSEIKAKNGKWAINENIRPAISMLHTQFNALVQGQDFIISESGTITFLHQPC